MTKCNQLRSKLLGLVGRKSKEISGVALSLALHFVCFHPNPRA
jgi:hypothetical protein